LKSFGKNQIGETKKYASRSELDRNQIADQTVMALQNALNASRRNAHFRRDLADGQTLLVELHDLRSIQNEPRPAADAALLPGLRQTCVDSVGETNAIVAKIDN
jgi:hypothetical protein